MTYLYGDSTASPLEINYVDFLRKALQACVEVLLAEHDVERCSDRRAAIERETDECVAALDDISVKIHGALDSLSRSPAETPVTRCANAVERAAANTVREHIERVCAQLAAEIEEIENESRRRRRAGQAAVEALLMQYDLPDTVSTVHVAPAADATSAWLEGSCPYGVRTRIDLSVPAGSPLAGEVRVAGFARELVIHVPGTGGWLRKQPRSLAVDLSKYYVVEVVAAPERTFWKLRSALALDSAGYDLTVGSDDDVVKVLATSPKEAPVAVELAEADVEAVRALGLALRAAALELCDERKALLELWIDETPMLEHEHPSVLVERINEAMAPVVLEIERRSVSPTELVLRRKLGDDRREEIFVSKAALRETLAQLPSSRRQVFDALGLGGNRAPTFELEPDMIVEESDPSIQITEASSAEDAPEPADAEPERASSSAD